MINHLHEKRILLIEDKETFSSPIIRWLTREGYLVTLATTYEKAIEYLDQEHFHLAIVDIHLVENEDALNKDGLKILADLDDLSLKRILPCIVLSAHATPELILEATQDLDIWHFIEKKPGYRVRLTANIEEELEKKLRVNFDLEYLNDSKNLIPEIASYIEWPLEPIPQTKPDQKLLSHQIEDLFGKLFSDAESLLITLYKPGLSGSAIVRVFPTMKFGIGRTTYVMKINRRDKIQTEAHNYKEHVEPYLPYDSIPKSDEAYTRHLGAIKYTFAERNGNPLREFDDFFRNAQSETIIKGIQDLFENTTSFWYDHAERKYISLPRLYYEAFNLTEEKLRMRIREILPDFDPTTESIRLEKFSLDITNPISWLERNHHECVLPVRSCITHGDLNGRNILTDKSGKFWLIDFYRTYESHILRDFVILETDLKFRLLPTPSLQDFLKLENILLSTTDPDEPVNFSSNLSSDARKTIMVIKAIRQIGYRFSRGATGVFTKNRTEYLLSLLMGTLNVIRLRHIEPNRKLQALTSAALICSELDEINGRGTPKRKTPTE